MARRVTAMVTIFALLLCISALGEGCRVEASNAQAFGVLLNELLVAYERPSAADLSVADQTLDAIRAVSEADYAVADAIAEHWRSVYLDPDYRLNLYHNDGQAAELEETGLFDSPTHAFVVLGYELKNGAMTSELKGRCDAAAAAARAYPSTILVCSGGATGKNNPDGHTEAGLMRDYLVKQGVDAARIYTDERAMTTVDNAVNTFEILRAHDIRTLTLVTSSYHQRWGQALYNCMAALYRRDCDYDAEVVENFCYDTAPPTEHYKHDDRLAIKQLAAMLGLPEDVTDWMEKDLRKRAKG